MLIPKKMNKKNWSLALIVLFMTWGFYACSNRTDNKDSVERANDMNDMKDSSNAPIPIDDGDAKFAVDAADGGLMEVELGNLAQQKATTQRVKDFGAMMVRDHSKANDQLHALATAKNISVPSSVSEDKMKMINNLREKNGMDFDREYIDHMVSDHKDDIDMFEKMADKGKDDGLRSFASTTLATLRAHLDSAQNIQTMLKNRK
jgi:putative membrane protein